jgi:hypothetical protein
MAAAIVFIPLTQSKVAIINFEDFDLVRPFRWCAAAIGSVGGNFKTWYCVRNEPDGRGYKTAYLHQLIMGSKGIDHINGDGLDNRRGNLRRVTHGENLRGFRRKKPGTTSRYRGVYFDKRRSNWKAGITHNYITIHLGAFQNEENAATAYDAAARKLGFPNEALNFK